MDFMVLPALFRNSIFMLLVLMFACCKSSEYHAALSTNSDSSTIVTRVGITYVNDAVYTGTIYTLAPNQKDTTQIKNYKDGKEDGVWKQFYENGRLKETRFFKEGKKEGEYIGWYMNGQKQLDYFFVNDEYEGTCREWASNGQLIKEMNYKAGHEEGNEKAWYDNGKIRSNYFMQDGRRYGLLGTKNCVNVSDSIFKK